MNISDVNASTHRSDHPGKAGITGAEPAAPAREISEEARAKSDRVEISDRARSADGSSEEVAFARKALENIPELSEARTAQLKDHIQSGYYNRSDVLQRIAERLGNDLAGGF